ncbi:MAG TPA: group II intron reverse transcriptase/maturase [Thermoanaerobaculia bacterium]|nr:group II intron reverse transcriptase/maturase [Thermoanaerobaculia bacterium]
MGNTNRTSSLISVSTRLQQIAKLARHMPQAALSTLSHHIDLEFLREAYRRTRKDGATGVDEMTAKEYASKLDEHLISLLERFKSGTYWAPPVRRVHIPKGDGTTTRPIGIPTFEDKVLQRAVTMVMEAVYEQDFLDCSWGFRPGRSAHGALETLREGLRKMQGGWVLDVDIKSFFDTIDHGQLRSFLDQRVRDGVLRRMIDKWLKAGVLEEGAVHYPDGGTPQGGVISPLLANIYLHHALDTWFHDMAKPKLRGEAFLVRYADDFVIVCAMKSDADKLMAVLPKRFGRYSLTLHPEKTRLVRFTKPASTSSHKGGDGGSGTFDLLGFTHYWRRSHRGRAWVIGQKTAKSRLTRAIRKVAEWFRGNRHRKVADQHRDLVPKLRGHYQYYGITGNGRALHSFYEAVRREWQRWLNRRSQRNNMTWERFEQMLRRYVLPRPRIVHAYAAQRSLDLRSRMR